MRFIVVVDDEPMLLMTLERLLKKQGYEVAALTDPLLVIDQVLGRCPDLVIADVVMPGLSGIELAIQLERFLPRRRILLFSGQANTLCLLAKAKAQGKEFEVFPKPIRPAELLRLVEERCKAGSLLVSGKSSLMM